MRFNSEALNSRAFPPRRRRAFVAFCCRFLTVAEVTPKL